MNTFLKQIFFYFSILLQIIVFYLWILLDIQNPFYFLELNLFFFHIDFFVDTLSLFFLFLTSFIINCCFIYNWNLVTLTQQEYIVSLFSVEVILLFLFSTSNLLIFYIFFEAVLIPFFLLIGLSSFNKRKIHASFLLFFYTFFGSLLMLLGIIYLYLEVGNFVNYIYLESYLMDKNISYLWWCFFLSFAIKIPVFPFHVWLPEAHVEAPTEGSVILAGILLKLGTYGLCRFLFFLFPYTSYYYSTIVIIFCLIGVIYTSLMAIRQIDIKKIVAYSSVGHMNFCTIGLFTFNIYSIDGSIFMMIGHGIVSSALFFLIGMVYQRYHTKLIYHYSGLCYTMPFYYFFFFFFMFSNISFPTTVNFVSEFLILVGIYISNNIISFVFCLISLFLGVIYNLYMFNKIFFGIPNKYNVSKNIDISVEELVILLFLFFFNLLLGVYPSLFLYWL